MGKTNNIIIQKLFAMVKLPDGQSQIYMTLTPPDKVIVKVCVGGGEDKNAIIFQSQ